MSGVKGQSRRGKPCRLCGKETALAGLTNGFCAHCWAGLDREAARKRWLRKQKKRKGGKK